VSLKETFIWLRGLWEGLRRGMGARLEAKPTTLVSEVQETPELLLERSVRAAPPRHPRAQSASRQVGKSASRQVRKSASRQVRKSALVLRQRSSATILPRLPRRRYHLLVTSGDVDNQRAECRRFGSASVIEYLFAWGVGFFPNQALWIIKFFLVFFETRFEPLAGLSLLGIDFRQFPLATIGFPRKTDALIRSKQ
jgi:hypothetical protein